MQFTFNSLMLRSAGALALCLTLCDMPGHALAQISVSITLAPPALPVYEQPALVEDGGIWAPGYWAYGPDGYFWVPGGWVQPPQVGLLWTPGYWGWGDGGYSWNEGYWGPTVGFYGGIAYGFGYSGQGYTGGHWQGGDFYYNTAVSHVDAADVHNVYSRTVVNDTTINRVSYNGGTGGVAARPTAAEQAAARVPHQPATVVQMQHRQVASLDKRALAPPNSRAAPATIAAARPAAMSIPVHAADLPPVAYQATARTGNAARDHANQQEQDALRDGQEKQRQDLQQRQADDHAQAARQRSAGANPQELERQHQMQTQQLVQRHSTEQQTLRATQEKKPEAKREAPHRE